MKARFQNVYGPGEVLGAGRWRGTVNTVWRNVTPTFIYKALRHEALPVENGGIARRDLIYVGDMARGADRVRGGGAGEVYNLASGVETTIRELAELINELTGNPTPIALKPARDWDHSGQRYGSTDKAGGSSASRPARRCARAWSARSSGRARTSTGSSAAWRGTPTGCPDLPAPLASR